MANNIRHINPEGLFKSPAFSQMVITEGPGKTIYIGGQDAVNAKGELVGKGDLTAQTEQVMRNIITALASCGATLNDVVKLTIYIVQGQDPVLGYKTAAPFMSEVKAPPAITGLLVSALAHPDYLVEIDATAFIGDK